MPFSTSRGWIGHEFCTATDEDSQKSMPSSSGHYYQSYSVWSTVFALGLCRFRLQSNQLGCRKKKHRLTLTERIKKIPLAQNLSHAVATGRSTPCGLQSGGDAAQLAECAVVAGKTLLMPRTICYLLFSRPRVCVFKL